MVAYRARREAHAEELQILQGVRRVCKLATVEMSLADYAKKTVPKTVDLPFTKEPEAYLFYAGIVSAGFDICDAPRASSSTTPSAQVRITLPPPRILSIDIQRFETINEDVGVPERDRARGSQPLVRRGARRRWSAGALAQGALDRAQIHAEELFEAFVARHGYTLVIGSGPARRRRPPEPCDEPMAAPARKGCCRDESTRRRRAARRVLVGAVGGARRRARQGKQRRPTRRATRELDGSCTDSDETALWWSPLAPAVGHADQAHGGRRRRRRADGHRSARRRDAR